MSVYTDEYLKAEYGVQYAWRLGPSLTSAGAATPATITAHGSPTNVAGDCFSESDLGPATRLNGTTQYLKIPAAVMAIVIGYASGTMLFTGRYNSGTGTAAFGGTQNSGTFANMIVLRLGAGQDWNANANKISVTTIGPSAANQTKTEYVTSGVHCEGQWHPFGLGWDPSNLYLIYEGCIVATVSRTANSFPTSAMDFGIGVQLNGSGTPDATYAMYGAMDIQDFLICNVALTNAQIQKLGARQNGRTGDIVYWGSRARRLYTRAKSKIVPILRFSDSNGQGTAAEKGFGITTARMIRAATGQYLAGRQMGGSDPRNDTYIVGVTGNLLGNTAGTPDNAGDPWTARLLAYDLSEYNRRDGTGYNVPFQLASCNLASGSSLSGGTTQGIFLNASTDPDWPMAAAAPIAVKMRTATYNGDVGVFTLQAKRVSNNATINANNPVSTNTGADTFNTDQTLAVGSNLAVNYGDVRVSIGAAVGPFCSGPITVLDTSRSSGFILAYFWNWGGHYTGHFMIAWKAIIAYPTPASAPSPFTRVCNLMACALAHAGNTDDPTMLIELDELQNDRNDTGVSYVWNGITFTFDNGTSTGNKRLGTQENIQAVVDMFRAAGAVVGINPRNLFFKFGPYFEISDPSDTTNGPGVYNMHNQLQRGVMQVCANDTTYQTCFIVDGQEAMPFATINANNWYESTGHGKLALFRSMGDIAGAAAKPYAASSGTRGRSRRARARKRTFAVNE